MSSHFFPHKKSRLLFLLLTGYLLAAGILLVFHESTELYDAQISGCLQRIKYRLSDPADPAGTDERGKQFSDLAVITITDADTRELEPFYNSRGIYAGLLEILAQLPVKNICINDTFRITANDAVDGQLVSAVEKAGNVIMGCSLRTGTSRDSAAALQQNPDFKKNFFFPVLKTKGNPGFFTDAVFSFPELNRAAKGCGGANFSPDADGVVRKIPLIFAFREGYILSLVLRTACEYLDVDPENIEIDFGKAITLRSAQFPRGEKQDLRIPIDNQGRMKIVYTGPLKASPGYLSVKAVFDKWSMPDAQDRIKAMFTDTLVVIAGLDAAGSNYSRGVFDPVYPNSLVTAAALNTILTCRYYSNASGLESFIIFLVLSVLLPAGGRQFAFKGFFFYTLLLLLVMLFFNVILFFTLLRPVDITAPGLAILSCLFTATVYYAWESRKRKPVAAPQESLAAKAPVRALNAETAVTGFHTQAATAAPLQAEQDNRHRRFGLNPKEWDIALLLDQGLQYIEIAGKLNISLGAVKKRINKLYTKCDVDNRTELIRKLFR